MRGQKVASERGIIPRFLTAIYRRGKELERKTEGATTIRVIMTYYEIYNVGGLSGWFLQQGAYIILLGPSL